MKTNTGPGRKGGGRAYHSRVEPFVAFVREQRQKRRTWKEIAQSLSPGAKRYRAGSCD